MKKITLFFFLAIALHANSQSKPVQNDVTSPLHALQPNYPTPYGKPQPAAIKVVLDKVFHYLESVTPTGIIDRKSGAEITDFAKIDTNSNIMPGDFRLTSYEWGVTYAGMLNVAAATGDKNYLNYTKQRFDFLQQVAKPFKAVSSKYPLWKNPLHQVNNPEALDDGGAVCAAMIKATMQGTNNNLRPLIDNYINFISKKQFRFPDGTLARNRPLPNTLWLDDMFMGVPALAQMGKFTGDTSYYSDAVKQVLQFSERMFYKEKNIFMHGWVQGMLPHPMFHWARANGWAFMAMVELLDVLPENYTGRKDILELFQSHAKGLASYQDGTGFWHQLLDKNDTYLETSATAIYAYCFARGINRGWLDAKAYAPTAALAWNAVATKVNGKGQVEGTCVGTGMGFDPAFYYYRPINVMAAHSYGPVLLAGGEMIKLLKHIHLKLDDSALQVED